jgi:anthranilate synthase component 2
VRYLEELGEEVVVRRNDGVTAADVLGLGPTHIVISPGPCTPAKAGISVDLVRKAGATVPILGVCLGHQCIGEAYGGRVVRGEPVHGKISPILHGGTGLFAGLPSPFPGTRYHSLVIDRTSLTGSLVPMAWTPDGTLMSVRHHRRPTWGVQFHPEAVLTGFGHALLRNFLALGRGVKPPGLGPGLPEPERPTVSEAGAPTA